MDTFSAILARGAPLLEILFSLLAAFWGASYLFIEVCPRGRRQAGRDRFSGTALAALVLLPIALHRGALAGSGRDSDPAPIALLALMQMAGPFMLIAVGQQRLTSSMTGSWWPPRRSSPSCSRSP